MSRRESLQWLSHLQDRALLVGHGACGTAIHAGDYVIADGVGVGIVGVCPRAGWVRVVGETLAALRASALWLVEGVTCYVPSTGGLIVVRRWSLPSSGS